MLGIEGGGEAGGESRRRLQKVGERGRSAVGATGLTMQGVSSPLSEGSRRDVSIDSSEGVLLYIGSIGPFSRVGGEGEGGSLRFDEPLEGRELRRKSMDSLWHRSIGGSGEDEFALLSIRREAAARSVVVSAIGTRVRFLFYSSFCEGRKKEERLDKKNCPT